MKIKIQTEYIKLFQLLKYVGTVGTGGIAKEVIEDGRVSVNGEICTVKGKKLYPGDTVTTDIDSEKIEII